MGKTVRLAGILLLGMARLASADIISPIGGGGHGGRGGGGPVITPVQRMQLHCSSSRYRYAECLIPGRGQVLAARILRQVSAARCEQGRTFGVTGDRIWVDRGCRADFEVYVQGCLDDFGDDEGEEIVPLFEE